MYNTIGGLVGGRNLDLPQFDTDHLQALHAAGHEVGCHTYEHVSTLSLSPAELEASLARNARWVAERVPVVDQEDLPDGGLRVRLRVADPAWLINLVLGLGQDVRRLAPRELADAVADRAADALSA